jgi:adenylosuccinate synthase
MIDKESLKINHMSTVSINKLFIIKNINKIKAIKEIEVNNKECIKMIKD